MMANDFHASHQMCARARVRVCERRKATHGESLSGRDAFNGCRKCVNAQVKLRTRESV